MGKRGSLRKKKKTKMEKVRYGSGPKPYRLLHIPFSRHQNRHYGWIHIIRTMRILNEGANFTEKGEAEETNIDLVHGGVTEAQTAGIPNLGINGVMTCKYDPSP